MKIAITPVGMVPTQAPHPTKLFGAVHEIFAAIRKELVLNPGVSAHLAAGYSLNLAEGVAMLVLPNRVLSINNYVDLAGGPYIIDDANHEPLIITLRNNHPRNAFCISPGDCIAHCAFFRPEYPEFIRG